MSSEAACLSVWDYLDNEIVSLQSQQNTFQSKDYLDPKIVTSVSSSRYRSDFIVKLDPINLQLWYLVQSLVTISKMRRKRQESREVAAPFRQIVKYVMSQAQSLQETVAIAQYHKSGMRGENCTTKFVSHYHSHQHQADSNPWQECRHSVYNEGV